MLSCEEDRDLSTDLSIDLSIEYHTFVHIHECIPVRSHILARVGERCTECIKVQVSFRERATNDKALLRKETYKEKGLHLEPFYDVSFCTCIPLIERDLS